MLIKKKRTTNKTAHQIPMIYLATLLVLSQVCCLRGQAQNKPDSAAAVYVHSKAWTSLNRPDYSMQFPATWQTDSSHQTGADLIILSPRDSESDRFQENVNITIKPLSGSGITLDSCIAVSSEQIKSFLTNVVIIENKRINQDNREYHRLAFTGQLGIFSLRMEQRYFLHQDRIYVLTLATESTQYEKYKETGNRTLDSFSFKQ